MYFGEIMKGQSVILQVSSNVLHSRALLQKVPLDVKNITTLTRRYHTSVQFVENYTLAQFDETICFFKLMENVRGLFY